MANHCRWTGCTNYRQLSRLKLKCMTAEKTTDSQMAKLEVYKRNKQFQFIVPFFPSIWNHPKSKKNLQKRHVTATTWRCRTLFQLLDGSERCRLQKKSNIFSGSSISWDLGTNHSILWNMNIWDCSIASNVQYIAQSVDQLRPSLRLFFHPC